MVNGQIAHGHHHNTIDNVVVIHYDSYDQHQADNVVRTTRDSYFVEDDVGIVNANDATHVSFNGYENQDEVTITKFDFLSVPSINCDFKYKDANFGLMVLDYVSGPLNL